MRKVIAGLLLATVSLALQGAARAEVAASSDSGFVVAGEAEIAGHAPPAVWQALVQPGGWWNDDHSWSGHAANMTLDPVAGGCFCEAIPGDAAGSVEHMRVVQARSGALLVMRGSLGPMQGEALTGVLTIALSPSADTTGTKFSWTYVVGGYARYPLTSLAPAVDGVVGEQMARLQAHLAAAD
ncbi:MAG: hypothetical protein ABIT10_11780 [Alteraurantiacibacter sp.]